MSVAGLQVELEVELQVEMSEGERHVASEGMGEGARCADAGAADVEKRL